MMEAGDLQNMMTEKMQKLSRKSPAFLYHGGESFGKTAASSWPTTLLLLADVELIPIVYVCYRSWGWKNWKPRKWVMLECCE